MLPTFFPSPGTSTPPPTLTEMLAQSLYRRGLLAGQSNATKARQAFMDRTEGYGYERQGKILDKIQNVGALAGSSYNSLLASLAAIGPYDNPAKKYLDENAKLYDANVTQGGKYRMAKSAAAMDLLAKDDHLGQAKETARQAWQNPDIFAGKAIGNLAGAASAGIAATALAPEASAAAIGAGMGGAFGLGAARQGAADAIDAATEEQLRKDPRYTGDREELKGRVTSYSENAPELVAITALSAALGAAGSDPKWISILQKAAKGQVSVATARATAREILKAEAGKSLLPAAIKSGAREAGTEFLEESGQQIAGNVMAGGGGADIDPMGGAVQAGTEAALMSAIPGFAAGPTEIAQARVGLRSIDAQDAQLAAIDETNKTRQTLGLGTYAKIPSQTAPEPEAPAEAPVAPPAPSRPQSEFRKSITDQVDAAVYDGMVDGKQPGEVLNSLGVSAKDIPRMARKYVTSFGKPAQAERQFIKAASGLEQVQPPVSEAVQEVAAEIPQAPKIEEAIIEEKPATVAPETPAAPVPEPAKEVKVKFDGQEFTVSAEQGAAFDALPKNRKGFPVDKAAAKKIIGQQAIPPTGVGKEVSHDGKNAIITSSKGNMRTLQYEDGTTANIKAVDIQQRPTQRKSAVRFPPGSPERQANLDAAGFVADESGKPKVFYHGTNLYDHATDGFKDGIEEFYFNKAEPGIHFGTKEQAGDKIPRMFKIMSSGSEAKVPATGGAIYPVHLKLNNPLRTPIDTYGSPEGAMLAISEGLIDAGYGLLGRKIHFDAINTKGVDAVVALREAVRSVKELGFDGLVYKNAHEGKNKEDSYVVFDAEQIKSATGNRGTFDTSSPNIKHSEQTGDARNQMVMNRYGGILPKDSDKEFVKAEKRGQKVDGREEIVIDPANDGVPSVMKQLAKHTEMTATVARVFDVIAGRAEVTTAKFVGWNISGNVFGTNYGNTKKGRVYINPLTIAKYAQYKSDYTAVKIYANLVHEIAHQVFDLDHGDAFGAEVARINNAIGIDLQNQLILEIENSLHMGSLKSMAEQQQPAWTEAVNKAELLVQKQRDILSGKETHETQKNDEQRDAGGTDIRRSDVDADSRPGKGARDDSGTGKAGDQREGDVPAPADAEAEGLASGSKPVGGSGAPVTPSSAVVKEQDKKFAEFGFWDKFIEKIVNRYNRIGQIVSENIENMATESTPRAVSNIENVAQMYVKPIAEEINKSGQTMQEFELWAVALNQLDKRGETIRKRGGELPFTDESAAMMVNKHKGNSHFLKAHGMLMEIMQLQRDLLVNSGLVSKKEMDTAVENMGKSYIPWKKIEAEESFGGGTVGGLGVSGPDLRMSMGSKTQPTSIIASAIEQYNRTAFRAEHNRVLNALARFVIADRSPKTWQVNKDKAPSDEVIDYHYKGEQMKLWIGDPILRRQLKGMKPSELDSFFEKMNGFTTVYKKLSTTWNPIFPFTNFLRDLPLGLSRVFVSEGKEAMNAVLNNLIPSLFTVNRYKKNTSIDPSKMPETTDAERAEKRRMQLAKTMFVSGAVPGWRGAETAENIRTDFVNELNKLKPGVKNAARRQASIMGKTLLRFNESIEAGIRLAYFDYLMSKYTDKAPTEQELTAIAKKVRALTADFQQRGEVSRQIGALYPFFNASVQGLNAVGELISKAAKGDKRAIQLFSMLAAVGVAEDLINSSAGGDDDEDGISDYDQMPDWMRRSRFVIPGPGNKSVIAPMTYGLSVAINMGKMLSRASRGQMTASQFGREMAQSINESANPIGGGGSALQTVSPLATDWMVQVAENKDWKGDEIFPERYPGEDWKPSSEISSRRDTELSKGIARWVNAATGGSEVQKGALAETPFGDMTPYPGAIDAFGRWISGGVGRLISDVGKSAYGAWTPDPADNPDKIPVISSFVTSPEQGFYVGRFFQQLNELKAIKGQAKDLVTRARMEELIAEYPERATAIENASPEDLERMLPSIEKINELKQNFAEIKAAKMKFLPMFQSIAKKIKNLEESGDPNAQQKIRDLVKSANRRLSEAA